MERLESRQFTDQTLMQLKESISRNISICECKLFMEVAKMYAEQWSAFQMLPKSG
jgi:hypothetical protein